MKPPEKDISHLLHAAMTAQQQGAVKDARRLYEQALRTAPRHPDALHLLGLTWIDEGQAERGLQLIRRAIAFRPDYLEAINNIAIELAKLDRHAEAQSFLERALRLNEAQPDVHYNLGRSLNALGHFTEALTSYDRAVALRPALHEAWNNRGITLNALREFETALESFDRALALKPDFHEAWTNRGSCLADMGRYDDALACFDNAIAAQPDYYEAWLQRGITLSGTGQDKEALSAFDKAIALQPKEHMAWVGRAIALSDLKRYADCIEALDKARTLHPDIREMLSARAIALQRMGRLDEALACADQAVALEPDHHESWSARGNVLSRLRRQQEALDCYDKAISLRPDEPTEHVNRAYELLTLGRLVEGWREHEVRWRTKRYLRLQPKTAVPDWRGEPLTGKRLLIFTEQGIGDIIQFSRYVPLVRALGPEIMFLCPGKILRMLGSVLDGARIDLDPARIETADCKVSVMSLPHYFQTDLGGIPADIPYLSAEPELRARWGSRIGPTGFRVGIAWQGNPDGAVDVGRSFPVQHFSALAALPGIRLISLQKGFGSEQLAELPAGMLVETLGDDFDSGADAFVDTAAVMESLDLIITSDTAVAHLAGALGRPVWVALQFAADWRWLLDRSDSPWYPTMRLFRQPAPGDWGSVFRDIRGALEEVNV